MDSRLGAARRPGMTGKFEGPPVDGMDFQIQPLRAIHEMQNPGSDAEVFASDDLLLSRTGNNIASWKGAAMSQRTLDVLKAALSIALLTSPLVTSPAGATDGAKIVEQLEASWPDWLPNLDQCPADLMPSRAGPSDFSVERCTASTDQCLDRCRVGDGNDCYAAALVLQRAGGSRVSEALFLKACALGIVSGCTNRAAGMDSGQGTSCAVRTFQLGCDRKDPWACTMSAFHLIRGIGVDRDIDRARNALAQSCHLGEDDEACIYGKALLKEIDH
ncbi:sel1 repeat family protein [Bradyrhizobium sp. Pear76]|uniref:hypothetical protein n=1 Tax=Bradyrhizobium oropedii TaxID=1571201 RepID=UPI001E427616|nr:hypothetical protein [Bradyrhizobium oropedii]MCC8963976.1 sel1 repeat family protein [Bradyrhizobium oropedii]